MRMAQKGCEECGQLSPFHAPTCKRLPAREDLIATLREMLAEKSALLETATVAYNDAVSEIKRLHGSISRISKTGDENAANWAKIADKERQRAEAAELQNDVLRKALDKIAMARVGGCSTGEAMSKAETWAREALAAVAETRVESAKCACGESGSHTCGYWNEQR